MAKQKKYKVGQRVKFSDCWCNLFYGTIKVVKGTMYPGIWQYQFGNIKEAEVISDEFSKKYPLNHDDFFLGAHIKEEDPDE